MSLTDYDTGERIGGNHGVLEGRRDKDYLAGAFSFVSWEERLKTGNWRPFLPPGERQFNGTIDTMACVTFSALNSIETQEKFLTGKQPNYSDRWIAKMSGTTHEGNYLYKVADAIRKYGLVLEEDYSFVSGMTWDEYYTDIPEAKMNELLAKGKAWLDEWSALSEFLTVSKDSFLRHLKHAPIQVTIPGHAIEHFLFEEQDVVNYFDTYNPFEKQIGLPTIQSALKIVLTPKTVTKRFKVNDDGKLGVMTLEGFTGTVQFCDKLEEWPEFQKLLKVDDTTPTITFPTN